MSELIVQPEVSEPATVLPISVPAATTIATSTKTIEPQPNLAIGKIVIVKFFSNFHKENSSKLITKTLCKVGFISRRYNGELPLNEEFWKCRIADEVSPGQKRGCWMLEPLSKIQETDIQRLVPGFYDERLVNGVLFVTPHEPGQWIMPLPLKKSITDVYSILVCLK